MLDRNYYVICDDNCKFPSMTYEQIIEAIAEATGNVPEHVEDAFITKVQESNHSGNLTFWKGTQAEFNALGVTATAYKVAVDANGKLYFIPASADDLTAHASRHASSGSDAITPRSIGAAYVPNYNTATMLAASWNNSTYSFESDYPNADFDITIWVAPTASAAEYDAFTGAKICGSASANIVTAIGDVPEIDIPIIIKAVAK